MIIDFPEHPVGEWQATPWWLFWRPSMRRRHWQWVVDHRGCECVYIWQYSRWQTRATRF